jgi:hypothetical protein
LLNEGAPQRSSRHGAPSGGQVSSFST